MHLSKGKYWKEGELYSGLIRLHILHHAEEEGVFGLGLIEQLALHGYKLSPGTLYPLLHSLEKKGLLRSHKRLKAGKIRRVYTSTPNGRHALSMAKEKVQELFGILFEAEPNRKSQGKRAQRLDRKHWQMVLHLKQGVSRKTRGPRKLRPTSK